jgi:rhamnosyltransferase
MQIVDFGSFNYVAFADQDDIWLPEKLQRAVSCLSGQGGGGYSSNLLAWNVEDDTYWIMQKSGTAKKFDYLFQGASAGCTYVIDVASASMVRQRMAPLKRKYCAGISHDWVIYAICRSAGVPWFHDTQSLIHYRQHSGNVYGARPGFAGIAARFGMISSGWYRDHVLWLEHVITNTADERKLLARLKRGRINDCFYLATQARDFRRDRGDVWKLRIALILGLLGNKGG